MSNTKIRSERKERKLAADGWHVSSKHLVCFEELLHVRIGRRFMPQSVLLRQQLLLYLLCLLNADGRKRTQW